MCLEKSVFSYADCKWETGMDKSLYEMIQSGYSKQQDIFLRVLAATDVPHRVTLY